MLTENFYDIIDEQLNPIIDANKHDPFFIKKNPEGKRSAALLLWFINKYNPTLTDIGQYITDGSDDSSCDIIFSNTDNFGESVYYIVQSKWNNRKNITGYKGISKEIKACLSDFNLILSGNKDKSKINNKFNIQYENLLAHIEEGGLVKFVFLSLSKLNHSAHENIDHFISELVQFEEIDIERLKRDYIEMEYKGARTHNPIEHPYEPKGEINISVEQNRIELKQPYKSYIFLVKPNAICDLFSRYGFALFYKNIRNPLLESNYNEGIADTIKESPEKFWYFNNGITAITRRIQKFHPTNTNIKVHGLQVINGAQTVYTIHNSYFGAAPDLQKKMDKALITLRIVESENSEFDEDVTRYTNSQNPVTDRDFRSNDQIQRDIQNYFFEKTNIWYERRRGEFRSNYRNADRISNESFAHAYLAYSLQRPVDAKQKRALFFKLKREGGFYEDIFNSKTNSDEMLAAYCINWYVDTRMKEYKKKFNAITPGKSGNYLKKDLPIFESQFILHASSHILALFKKQLDKAYKSSGVNNKIYSDYTDSNFDKWDKIYESIVKKLKIHVNKMESNPAFSLTKYFKSNDYEETILRLV